MDKSVVFFSVLSSWFILLASVDRYVLIKLSSTHTRLPASDLKTAEEKIKDFREQFRDFFSVELS